MALALSRKGQSSLLWVLENAVEETVTGGLGDNSHLRTYWKRTNSTQVGKGSGCQLSMTSDMLHIRLSVWGPLCLILLTAISKQETFSVSFFFHIRMLGLREPWHFFMTFSREIWERKKKSICSPKIEHWPNCLPRRNSAQAYLREQVSLSGLPPGGWVP
jgi:hypothetical protein